MALDNYKKLIDRLAREKSGETVLNGSVEHAAIINERMFNYAQSSMDIVTRRFDPRIFGADDLIESARLFSGAPDRKTRIAVENADPSEFINHPFAVEFEENENIEIRRIPADFHSMVNVNFTVMDNDSYRFEKDKKEAVAFAAFGDAGEFPKTLKTLFDAIWNISTPLKISDILKKKTPV